MAKIGLKYPVYAVATETTSAISYSGGAVLAKAISASISITPNDVKLYADDAIAESDRSFSSGTVTIEIDNFTNAAQLALLGYTQGSKIDASAGNYEMLAGGTDSPAYVGFGFYGKKVVSGTNKWRAIWLKKVQFSEPADDLATRADSVAFGTTTLNGMVMVAADGYWKEEGTFDTEAEAVAYLNTKSGISSSASNNLTDLEFANGTLIPTFGATTYLYSCACTDDTAITAKFSAGTASVYVDGAFVETLTTTVAGSTIALGAGVSKLIQIVVQESGKSAVTYTIVAQEAA